MEEVATMPSNNQEFCLRWNNFHNSLVTAIDGFKNDLDFVDVTISCEGQCLQAHKMLLSACSVLFRDLLKANPCQHPIVIMPTEVKFIDLEKMLRFIYQGEVNVQQENLARFLRTAEMLKIRGLAEDNEKQKVLRSSSPRPPEINEQASTSPKRPRLSSDHQTFNQEQPGTPNDDNSRLSGNDSDSEMLPVKQEMIENKDCDLDGSDEPYITDSYLKETSTASTPVCSQSSASNQQSTGGVPPPPGPLLPSYVPPPQIKPQDGMPMNEEESAQAHGGFASLVADHPGSAGTTEDPGAQGRTGLGKPQIKFPRHLAVSSMPSGLSRSVTAKVNPSKLPTSKNFASKSPTNSHIITLSNASSSINCLDSPKSTGMVSRLTHTPQQPKRASAGDDTFIKPANHNSPSNNLNMSGSVLNNKSPTNNGLKGSPLSTNRSPSSLAICRSQTVTPNSSPISIYPTCSPNTTNSGVISTINSSHSSLSILFTHNSAVNTVNSQLANASNMSYQTIKDSVFTCDICFKTFTSKSNLNKHKRVQHSGEEYACPLCSRTFRNRYYIKEHIQLCSTASLKKAAASANSLSQEDLRLQTNDEVMVNPEVKFMPHSEAKFVPHSEAKFIPHSEATFMPPPDRPCSPSDQPTDLVMKRPQSPASIAP